VKSTPRKRTPKGTPKKGKKTDSDDDNKDIGSLFNAIPLRRKAPLNSVPCEHDSQNPVLSTSRLRTGI